MKYGFVRAAAVTPSLKVADTEYNTDEIIKNIKAMAGGSIKLAIFPELSITGYTCGDLFLQDRLLAGALEGLARITEATAGTDMVVCAGLPLMVDNSLYNTAAVIHNGRLLGFVPKKYIPNYSEFYEARHFKKAPDETQLIIIPDASKGTIYCQSVGDMGASADMADILPEQNGIFNSIVPFGTNIIFAADNLPGFRLALEICEDLWVPLSPGAFHASAGAVIIGNLSASDDTTGKSAYRHSLVGQTSASLICAYIYADAGIGESTTDLVYSGDNIIAENGNVLAESKRFRNGIIYSEIDLERLVNERRRIGTFASSTAEIYQKNYTTIHFAFTNVSDTPLTRHISMTPFVPEDLKARAERCEDILNMQAAGLRKRLEHTHSRTAVIGISGGLDSTLALIVTARAFDLLGMDRKNIIAVTMPCFGTTDRTYHNAVSLIKETGATFREVNIKDGVTRHFMDIDHDPDDHSVTYENVQARYRTMILMNIANETGGLVIGTGDLSEIALGWSTYNADHMSMYGVNCTIPKTLVRYLVDYEAETTGNKVLMRVLKDVLATPVSPELLPPEEGRISQKTEDIIGPYELHDFFLYYHMRFGYRPCKVMHLASYAFNGKYDNATILKWMRNFYWRFFSQQFKRSCIPDGPKVGSVALSPRGDWRMPSDASVELWKSEVIQLQEESDAKAKL
jgi:NAD+ synthase (glutamine-hydrolysing)